MGPLYGMVFKGFVDASKKENVITGEVVKNMLEKALKNLQIITDAAEGDKTLLDVICPSMRAYRDVFRQTGHMKHALIALKLAADVGVEQTKEMIARIGRASRLGERSRGYQDAGATSCALILNAMADAMIELAERNQKCRD